MTPSAKLNRSLVDVAMGRAHADLVIRNGQWVCVQSGEIIDGTDIAVVNGRVAYVGENASHILPERRKRTSAVSYGFIRLRRGDCGLSK